jgi:hypothetical protein
MPDLVKELWDFLSSAAPAFWAAIGSGIFFGIDQAAEHFWPSLYTKLNTISPSLRRRLAVLVLFGATAYGGFQAWRNEHVKLIERAASCDEIVKKLELMHTESSIFVDDLSRELSRGQLAALDDKVTVWGEGVKGYILATLGAPVLSRMVEGTEDLPNARPDDVEKYRESTLKSVAFLRKRLGELIDRVRKCDQL